MLKRVKKELAGLVKGSLQYDVSLKCYTTFRIGGLGKIVIIPQDVDDLSAIIEYLNRNKMDYMVIGRGSNILISDKGIKNVVLNLTKSAYFKRIIVEKNKMICFAGASLSNVLKVAMENSLGGLEFLTHIPGSIGGALYMNAGAFGSEISSFVEEVTVINQNGTLKTYTKDKLLFAYRRGIQDKLIVSVVLKLVTKSKTAILQLIKRYQQERKRIQPVGWSAGSVFKNGKNFAAGQLIDSLGLKGISVNDAYVSNKHANFIINKGQATAKDVILLIKRIKEEVLNKKNIVLETEIKLVGEF